MFVPENFPDRSVCVIGLGYVGLTLAAAMASVGFRVTGVERRQDVVDQLRLGKPHFFEPGLEDTLQRAIEGDWLRIETEIPVQCEASVFIITVGTPLGPDGLARLDMIENATRQTAAAMSDNALVILRSTVRLGTTRKTVMPILGAMGQRYQLAFCPERTLEGTALTELRQLPQIVGADDDWTSLRAAQIFNFLTPTTIRVRDVETAEMIKLVDNAQRDVRFAYANEVARMCDAIGISALEVINAGKLGYPRTNLPLPGPVGGPCLEKDPYILAEGLAHLGTTPSITLAARAVNEGQPRESVAAIARTATALRGFPERPVITLLGIAFKGRPVTDDLRGTMAKPILAALRETFPDATFRGFDAAVAAEAIRDFGLEAVNDLEAAFRGTNIAVIANNHPVFAAMPIEALTRHMAKPGLVYDFWNSFDARDLRLAAGTGYMALGSHGRAILPTA